MADMSTRSSARARRRSKRCADRARGVGYLMPDERAIVIVVSPRRALALLRDVAACLGIVLLLWAYLFVGALWAGV